MKKLLIAAAALVMMSGAGIASTASNKTDVARELSVFNALIKELQLSYVDTIDVRATVRNAIAAMLSEIDPYTEYFPADDQDEFRSIATGQYGGIGAVIYKRPDGRGIIINRPQPGSPAREAGLRHGDVIREVNGTPITADMSVSDVSRMLRGQAGTPISVSVMRPHAEDSLLTFDFTRGEILVDPLPWHGMMPDGTGYMRLTTFNEQSYPRVRDALASMLRTNPTMPGLIIDLRENGGGLVESAVQIAGLFVDKGTEIVNTRGREQQNHKSYRTTSKPLARNLPLVILTDDGTASASEILAGSLQDLDRAVIVGQRSFGKGLVQSTRPLPLDGLLKVTVARYYTPSGRLVQAIDYSHRNPDGSVARIPDSLTNTFTTTTGRIVRDGGGITPDVVTTEEEGNRLLYNLMSDMWIYDFATRYAAKNATIGDAATYELPDSVFAAFKASIDPDRLEYDRLCETGLKYLREAAEAEGYMTDSVAAQFDVLASMLRHNLDHDLEFNRSKIIDLLSMEITDRYYNDSELTMRAAMSDADVDTARTILLDKERYRRILNLK